MAVTTLQAFDYPPVGPMREVFPNWDEITLGTQGTIGQWDKLFLIGVPVLGLVYKDSPFLSRNLRDFPIHHRCSPPFFFRLTRYFIGLLISSFIARDGNHQRRSTKPSREVGETKQWRCHDEPERRSSPGRWGNSLPFYLGPQHSSLESDAIHVFGKSYKGLTPMAHH